MSNITEPTFNLSFDDLFAFRFQYQDSTSNEYIIIQKLKDLLYQHNPNLENEIDDYLFQFYITYGYPITLDEIKTIDINQNAFTPQSVPIDEFDTINSSQESGSHDSMPDLIPTEELNFFPYVTYSSELDNVQTLNTTIEIFLNILNNTYTAPMNDVVVTTNDESIESLETITITELQIKDIGKCSICMTDFEVDDKILDIKCKHNFHKECLEEYLKKYNHICPICRQDIGNTQTDTGNTS